MRRQGFVFVAGRHPVTLFQGMFLELRSCYPEDYSALSCLSGSLQTDCRGWEEVCE